MDNLGNDLSKLKIADFRGKIFDNANPETASPLAVFAELYETACSLEIFKPTDNGAVLFKAMLCGLTAEEFDANPATHEKTLETPIPGLMIIFVLLLKDRAAERGLKSAPRYNASVKQWTGVDSENYDDARKRLQGFRNRYNSALSKTCKSFDQLAAQTAAAVAGVRQPARQKKTRK